MGWRDDPIVGTTPAVSSTGSWRNDPVVGAAVPALEPAPQTDEVISSLLGLKREPSGQTYFEAPVSKTPQELRQMPLYEAIPINIAQTFGGGVRAVTGGVRNAVAGVASLPADIAEALGSQRSPMIDSFINNLPEIRQEGITGEIVQGVTQYAPAALAGASIMPNAVKDAPRYARWATNALKTGAAALADMLVTDPDQASTIGDIFQGSPTDITPEDNNLTRRLRVGVETPAAELAAKGIVNTLKAGNTVREVLRTKSDPVKQKELAEKLVMKSASDPEKAARNIRTTQQSIDPADGFVPTGPEASKDIGLLQLQRGTAQDPKMVARQQENAETTVRMFDEGTQRTVPNGENRDAIAAAARAEAERILAPVRADLTQSERRGAQIDRRIQTQTDELDAQRAAGPSASERIAEGSREVRQKVMQTKNELYDTNRVDPEGRLVSDSTDFLAQVDNIKEKPGAVDSGLPANIKVELERVRPQTPDTQRIDIIDGDTGRVMNPKEPTTMSFDYLSNLRTSISGAIADAKAANKGARVETLTQFKNLVNNQIDNFANSSDPAAVEAAGRLGEANQYFKDTASPLLRQGVGGKLTQAENSGRPIPDTEVGSKYLGRGAGARERVADFNRVVGEVADPEGVETAARDWLVSDLANSVKGKLTPERIELWMKNKDISEILDGRPEVRKEVNQMLNRIRAKSGVKKKIEEEILTKTAKVKATQKEINESALGNFLGKEDPYEEVGKVLEGSNPRQRMRQISAAAKKDTTGEATNGVKDAIKTWMRKKVLNSKAATGRTLETASKKPSFGELDDIISTLNDGNVRDVLEDVYGANSKELRNLDKVRNQLEITSRQERVKGTIGSDTQPIGANAQRTTTTLSAILAQNFKQNRILNLAASWLPDNSQQAIKDFMIDMILDPQMSETLMLRQTTENASKIEDALRTYITNNILGTDEDRRQNNEKDDTLPPDVTNEN